MRDQCVVCSTNKPVVAPHTVSCEYRPRAKDAHRGAQGGAATIPFYLCQEHAGAAKEARLCGWDWWDMVDAM